MGGAQPNPSLLYLNIAQTSGASLIYAQPPTRALSLLLHCPLLLHCQLLPSTIAQRASVYSVHRAVLIFFYFLHTSLSDTGCYSNQHRRIRVIAAATPGRGPAAFLNSLRLHRVGVCVLAIYSAFSMTRARPAMSRSTLKLAMPLDIMLSSSGPSTPAPYDLVSKGVFKGVTN